MVAVSPELIDHLDLPVLVLHCLGEGDDFEHNFLEPLELDYGFLTPCLQNPRRGAALASSPLAWLPEGGPCVLHKSQLERASRCYCYPRRARVFRGDSHISPENRNTCNKIFSQIVIILRVPI